MDAMPRPRLPHLRHETTRHGVLVWYVRIDDGPRKRLRKAFGTPEFRAEYDAAVASLKGERGPAAPAPAGKNSLRWLIDRYKETGAWRDLSLATQRQRENIFAHVIEGAGHAPYGAVTRQQIVAGRERRAATPAQARNYLDAMRGLFRWALSAEHVAADPAAGVDNPKRPKGGEGFPVWTEDDVRAYERRWPIGTKERVWLDVLLYTGLRRGDAVRLGRQHVRDGEATIRTEKSGFTTEVTIPIPAVLAETLAAGPCGDLAFICGESRQPLAKESFGNMFRMAAREAGVRKSPHGLRKIAATRAANAGNTVAELEARFGWNGGTMASHYTKAADRRRLSRSGAAKEAKGTPAEPLSAAPDGGAAPQDENASNIKARKL